MNTVWKYRLELDKNDLKLPKGSNLLTVMDQNGEICLWCRCDDHAELEVRRLIVSGTGQPAPAPETSRYVGSVCQGPFVWHVFELLE